MNVGNPTNATACAKLKWKIAIRRNSFSAVHTDEYTRQQVQRKSKGRPQTRSNETMESCRATGKK